jgi:hypothetical protein
MLVEERELEIYIPTILWNFMLVCADLLSCGAVLVGGQV